MYEFKVKIYYENLFTLYRLFYYYVTKVVLKYTFLIFFRGAFVHRKI